MNILGKTRIFKNEYNGKGFYSTSVSNKNQDGTYEKLYISVQFKKGMEVEGDIDIKDGFLSMYKDRNGLAKPKIVVLDYTELETAQNNNYQDPFNNTTTIPDDLPF